MLAASAVQAAGPVGGQRSKSDGLVPVQEERACGLGRPWGDGGVRLLHAGEAFCRFRCDEGAWAEGIDGLARWQRLSSASVDDGEQRQSGAKGRLRFEKDRRRAKLTEAPTLHENTISIS